MRVTECLKLLGFLDDMWSTQDALDRGTALHLLAQFDNEGTLDPESVDDRLLPKLEGWRKFKREKRVRVIESEFKVDFEALGMTGTPDCLIEMDGQIWIADIKSGATSGWHRWQVALYALLWSLKTGKATPKRCVVYLHENDYRLTLFEDRRDVERAKALITAAHIRKEAS